MKRAISKLYETVRARPTVRSHIWQTLANYLQQGFGLLLSIFMARILMPSDFGDFAYVAATVLLCFLPASWSLTLLILADGGRSSDLFRRILGMSWMIIGTKALILGGLVGWLLYSQSWQLALLAFLFGAPEALREIVYANKAWLEAGGNFKPNSITAGITAAIVVVTMIPAALWGCGSASLAIPGIVSLLSDFFVFRHYGRKELWAPIEWTALKNLLGSGFWIWLGTISDIGIFRLDKWFVGHFTGSETLGHYNRAFNFAPLSQLALGSFLVNPTTSALVRSENQSQRRRLFLKTTALVSSGAIVNWAIWWFYAPQLVPFIFGNQWEESIPFFKLFSVLSGCYVLYMLPATVLYSFHRYRELAIVRLLAFSMFLGLLIVGRDSLTPGQVGWLLQWTLAAQGVVLFGRVFFLLK